MTKLVKMVSNVVNITLHSVSIFLPKKKRHKAGVFLFANFNSKKMHTLLNVGDYDIRYNSYLLHTFAVLFVLQFDISHCHKKRKTTYNTANNFRKV